MSDVRKLFDLSAASYDRARRQLVPCFDAFYGTSLEVLDHSLPASPTILELGAGTGLYSQMLLDAFPTATVTLCDLSEAMLDRARDRLAAYDDRIRVIEGDFCDCDLGGSYDAVVSALAIHHLEDAGKRRVYARAYEALRPNGILLNADEVRGATASVQLLYYETWLARVKANGVTAEDLQLALRRKEEDRHASLGDQLGWFRDVGFEDVGTWFQDFSFAVFSGRKAVSP